MNHKKYYFKSFMNYKYYNMIYYKHPYILTLILTINIKEEYKSIVKMQSDVILQELDKATESDNLIRGIHKSNFLNLYFQSLYYVLIII